MIGNELSTIQANTHAQAAIDSAIADFLAHGGKIQVLDRTGVPSTPPPADMGFAGREWLREAKAKAVQVQDDAALDQVRAMAATMTLNDVMRETGLGRGRLRSLAQRYGFAFQPGKEQMKAKVSAANTDEQQDAKNAERLKAFCAAGVTRQQAAKHMGVRLSVVLRLIEKFKLDYPLNNVWRG